MMKLLHTSDWHLGHTLYNYDRAEEQRQMLQQIADIVRDEQPDVFILSGDVYHTAQPSASVQTMFTEAIVRMHEACPRMTMVITAGNHDSGVKHEVFSTPWKALNVFAIGTIKKEHLEEHIIEVPEVGYVIAMPYVSDRNIPEGVFQQLLDMVAERNKSSLPVVMMAHTAVSGCDFVGHEHATLSNVGGIDTIDVAQLGNGYDYLALGHIHHAQFVHTGHHNVRYAGSPLPVSFDEAFDHSVSLVTIAGHGAVPVVTPLSILNPFPLVSLPSQGFASWDEVKKLLEDFPKDVPAYIRLNVEVEDFLPADANYEAIRLIQDKRCRFCYINARRKDEAHSESKVLTVEEFQSEQPIDIARRFAEDTGATFDDGMSKLFNLVLETINEENQS